MEKRHLPLKSDSVDQIWLMSVFGGFHTVPEKLPDGTSQYTLGLNGAFQELSRVAKRGGKIYIGELYAPMDEESLMWLTDIDYSDFDLEKKIYKGREEIISVLEKIAGGPIGNGASYSMRDPKYTPFFIELTKK
jgi:hypothetical protein